MSTVSTSGVRRLRKGAGYHHGRPRDALVEMARKRLAAGADEPGLRELASALRVTPNAVYRHFANKDALLAAVAATGFAELTAATRAALAAPGAAPLVACGEAYLAFAAANPALYRLMFGRGGRFPDAPELDAAARECMLVIVGAVGAVRPDDPSPMTAMVTVWALVHGYATLRNEGLLARVPEAERPTPAGLMKSLAL